MNEKKTRKHSEMKKFIGHFFIAIFVRLLSLTMYSRFYVTDAKNGARDAILSDRR